MNTDIQCKSREGIRYILLASLLPFAFTLIWLSRNTQLPGNDASNYLMTAVNIYQYFAERGVLSGLWHFYIERGWRPIFFPNLAVPFLILSRGNLFIAYWSVAVSCILASTVYIYLYFRISLGRYAAVVATNLIGLLPLVLTQVVMFYAEAALFVCLLGSLYHLIKSDYLTNLPHSVGFALLLTLGVIIRPVEAVTDLLFVLIYFIGAGWYRGSFTTRQIFWFVLSSFLAVTIFLLMAIKPYYGHQIVSVVDNGGIFDIKMGKMLSRALAASMAVTMLLGIAWLIPGLVRNRKALCNHVFGGSLFLPAFILVYVLVLIWFLPAAFGAFEWIYRTSLGDVASSTGSLHGSQFSWQELKKYIIAEGQAAVAMITAVALLAMVVLPWQTTKRLLFSPAILCLLLTLPFPFWESFYTVQVVTRKLSFAFPALLMVLLMIGLQNGNLWKIRCALITAMLIVQFGLLLNLVVSVSYTTPTAFMTNSIGYFIPQPSTISPNPHDVVISFLDEQAKKYNLHNIGLEVNPGTPDARHFVEAEPIDPFLLSTMLVAMKKNYSTGYPYYSAYSENNLLKLNERYDAIFLSDSIDNMTMSDHAVDEYNKKYLEEGSSSLRIFYTLLKLYSEGKLNNAGWKLGPCIVINMTCPGIFKPS